MTTCFYAPPTHIRDGVYVRLPDDEAAHAVRVLRKRPGDEIVVVDGAGGWYRVRLDQTDRHQAGGSVVEARRGVGEPSYTLSIGLALLKNRNRFETFLEKATELGVTEVIPLVTNRTQKGKLKAQRARHLLVAAMKQCGRSRLVDLTEPMSLEAVWQVGRPDLVLLAHEQAGADDSLAHALAERPAAQTIRILIGPEGGFTDDEVEAARQAGYGVVSLGPRRLRAETAGIVAASAVLLARNE